ncbi:MAG: DUF3303 family protein [Rubrobacter sp.]|nr:DUF3303 family protein [Rubrobacter sp.]
MLFAVVLKVKAGTAKDRVARRAQWQYPEGINVIAEYWLQTNDPSLPNVVSIYEAEEVAPIMASLIEWDDVFDITIVPAITAEEGLKVAEQMSQVQ